MISRNMLDNAINQIATNNIGTLQSVDGNTATVVIDGQVYPDVLVTSRLDLDKYVGDEVVISFADKNNSNGIIVGVLGANNDLYTKEEVDNKIGGIDSIPGPKGDVGPPGPQGEKGLQGEQGIQGPKGEVGPTGKQGPKGDDGPKGEIGPRGLQGIPGEDGYTPIKGIDYNDGAVGSQGPRGDKGNTGSRGPQGEQGPKGLIGPRGLKGDTGSQGEQGPKGLQGVPGKDGYTPVKGTDYFDGAKGDTGSRGPQGIQGPEGKVGPKGNAGPKGDSFVYDDFTPTQLQGLIGPQGPRGLQGLKGDTGPQGEQGTRGLTGAKGDAGARGLKGDQGPRGLQGVKGDNGYTPIKGVDYFDGERGPKGDKGDTGPRGTQGIQGEPGAAVADSVEWNKVLNKPSSFKPITHTHNSLNVPDTRAINDKPSEIPSRTLSSAFKQNTSVGNPPVSTGSSYAHILTMSGWTGAGAGGGGETTQLAFGDGLAIRMSSGPSVWGEWKRLATMNDIPTSASSLPTPSAAYRGKIFTLLDNTNGDRPYICIRNKDGSYSWEDMLGVFT